MKDTENVEYDVRFTIKPPPEIEIQEETRLSLKTSSFTGYLAFKDTYRGQKAVVVITDEDDIQKILDIDEINQLCKDYAALLQFMENVETTMKIEPKEDE